VADFVIIEAPAVPFEASTTMTGATTETIEATTPMAVAPAVTIEAPAEAIEASVATIEATTKANGAREFIKTPEKTLKCPIPSVREPSPVRAKNPRTPNHAGRGRAELLLCLSHRTRQLGRLSKLKNLSKANGQKKVL